MIFTKLFTIDDQHPRIEIIVAFHPKHLLHISAIYLFLDHHLLLARSHISIPEIISIQLCNIPQHNRIAVDINGFVYFRKHFRDKQAKICCFGIIIPKRKFLLYRM